MTSTGTLTAAFTIVHARYIGAKIGTDLRLLHNFYGRPPLSDIDDFAEEAALLLRDGYLGTVDYGFKDRTTNVWKLRFRYTATTGGHLRDDRPGNLPTRATAAGYSWSSYLTYSSKFLQLSPAEQRAVDSALPITRVGATQPTLGAGTTQSGHGYGRNGTGVTRDIHSAW